MAERKTFLLRMDPALWADLEAWAQDELRSVNGQVEFLLKQAVARRKGKSEPTATPKPPSPALPSPPTASSEDVSSSGYDLLD